MIIQNKIILILGRPGKWKTYLAAFIASNYRRIYSNVNILDSRWNTVVNRIKNIHDLKDIEFNKEKWVVLLDEWWININARASSSKENREYGELGMLWRKLNVDFIICAQLGRMIDVYFRELANYIFEMNAWFDRKDYLMFEARIYGGGWENIIKIARFDLFEWSRLTGYSYNTLESSRIEKKEKKESWIVDGKWNLAAARLKKKDDGPIISPFDPNIIHESFLDTRPIFTNEFDEVFGKQPLQV